MKTLTVKCLAAMNKELFSCIELTSIRAKTWMKGKMARNCEPFDSGMVSLFSSAVKRPAGGETPPAEWQSGD